MTDEELRSLFEAGNAETRHHFDVIAEALRGDVREEVASVREEVASVRGEVAGVRGEVAGVRGEVAGVKRQVEVLSERVDSKFDLLSETMGLLDEKLDRNVVSIREEMRQSFADTHALIRFGYRDLDQRKR
jgi:archaellum component FlaC